jgi:hypothetical protein
MTRRIVLQQKWEKSSITIYAPDKKGMCKRVWILCGKRQEDCYYTKRVVYEDAIRVSKVPIDGGLSCSVYFCRKFAEIMR